MNVTLTVEQSGLRADQYLAGVLDGLTRSAAQKLLEDGAVTLSGRPGKKNDRTAAGMEVSLTLQTIESRHTSVAVDHALAGQYLTALRALGEEYSLPDDLTLSSVARLPDVFTLCRDEEDEEEENAEEPPAQTENAGAEKPAEAMEPS